jgi:hypothetical protein
VILGWRDMFVRSFVSRTQDVERGSKPFSLREFLNARLSRKPEKVQKFALSPVV